MATDVGKILALASADGSERWAVSVVGQPRTAVVTGGLVLVATNGGELIAFGDSDAMIVTSGPTDERSARHRTGTDVRRRKGVSTEGWRRSEMSAQARTTRHGRLLTITGLAITGALSLAASVPVVLGQSAVPSPIVPPSMAPGSAPTPQWHGVTDPPARSTTPVSIPCRGSSGSPGLDSDAFSIFDTDGTLLETWGTAGKEDGQFHSGGGPHSLIVAFEP